MICHPRTSERKSQHLPLGLALFLTHYDIVRKGGSADSTPTRWSGSVVGNYEKNYAGLELLMTTLATKTLIKNYGQHTEKQK